jgi:predicted ester cyclase
MTVKETRAVMDRYLAAEDHDVSMMADDVLFRIMATGVEYRTGPAVAAMFGLYYRTAFQARSEARAVMVGAGWAVWEGTFIGRHVGAFEGIPATGQDVRLPLCVCYDFRYGKLVEGRVYLETQAFFDQVGAGTPDGSET